MLIAISIDKTEPRRANDLFAIEHKRGRSCTLCVAIYQRHHVAFSNLVSARVTVDVHTPGFELSPQTSAEVLQ